VLKIEPIGGDITRRSRAPVGDANEFSALFISTNRGKRSLAIDIKHASGREVMARLVAQADVLVQNFRPVRWNVLTSGHRSYSGVILVFDQRRRRGRSVREEEGLRSDHSRFVRLRRHPVSASHESPADDTHHCLRQD